MAVQTRLYSPVVLALAVLAVLVLGVSGELPSQNVQVNITNMFDAPRVTVTVHCQSKDDDLGLHDIAPLGTWGFHFHPRLVTGTLFFCRFMWAQTFEYFNIYDEGRDSCHNCCWTMTAKGPCLGPCGEVSVANDSEKCWPWNKKA